MMAMYDCIVADNDSPFDAVFQLTDIARPMVAHQHIYSWRRNSLDGFAVFAGVLFNEMISKQQDVSLALPQWWHKDGEDIQAIVKIFTECPAGNRLFNIFVG